MLRPRMIVVASLTAVLCAAAPDSRAVQARQDAAPRAAQPFPASLSNEAFARLSTQLSEPAGTFRSENLVSNEHTHQYVIPELERFTRPGAVYLGVAPDQNFTYMAATRPRMAFIVDIRRGNLLQHLMYKAIFELSADRAEFVSRLFSKPRPPGLTAASTVFDIFSAYARVSTSEELYASNLAAIRAHITRRRAFPLTVDDLEQLESIYFAFFWQGPSVRYSTVASGFGGRRGVGGGFPTFEEIITQTDYEGAARSYLASEDRYRFIKGLQEKNLVVPVMGDFAGPKALRGVGRWVRERGGRIGAYYVSNVEQYLFQDGKFEDFARNVATLPVDSRSTFIRSVSARYGYNGTMIWNDLRASALYPIPQFIRDFQLGLLRTYGDLNARSR